jgi:REP element-mobilizing transposase RayT
MHRLENKYCIMICSILEVALIKTRRNLPHWYREGSTYFVTFRLIDSVPQPVLNQWKREKQEWLALNPEPHNQQEQIEFQKVFSRKQQEFLDAGHGSCILRVPTVFQILANAFQYFDGVRYELGDLIVMPNHVHLLVTPLPEHYLPNILHSWKSFTSNAINKQQNRKGPLWQDESFDHLVRSLEQLEHYQRYIAENPKRARLSKNEYFYYENKKIDWKCS